MRKIVILSLAAMLASCGTASQYNANRQDKAERHVAIEKPFGGVRPTPDYPDFMGVTPCNC